MKIISCIFICFLLFIIANGQAPTIGIIDFYGLRTVQENEIRAALQLKEGDNLSDSKETVEKRLSRLRKVQDVKLNAICCDSGKLILYVGINEKGTASLEFRPSPKEKIPLPGEIVKTVNDFYGALERATLKGESEEDDSQGHALMKNAEGRAIQEKFIPFANNNLPLLRKVLYRSANAEHRSFAAQIIAYYKDKKIIVKDLVYAIGDEDENVRNNSMRALGIIAGFAQNNPEKKIKVPIKPFVDMLNSIEWTDRNKSSIALWQLTQKSDRVILSNLRKNALTSLIEMSNWKSFGHAFPSFCILARIKNIPEKEIMKLWESGKRFSTRDF